MRIIKPATVHGYGVRFTDARQPLVEWLALVQAAPWRNIREVRQTFPHADAVTVASGRMVTVFNIKGNTYRLIVAIHYETGIVFIRDFLTHAEYDKDQWKDRH